MDTARRVVLVECWLGGFLAVYGLAEAAPALRSAWWVALAGAAGTATWFFLEEHHWTDWDTYRRGGATVGFLFCWVAFVAVVAVTTALPVATVVSASIGGTGLGLCCYRAVYGLVRPVPPSRLERTGSWG